MQQRYFSRPRTIERGTVWRLVDVNNHYLVENYTITYLTSDRGFLRLGTEHAQLSDTLLFFAARQRILMSEAN